MKRGSKHKSQEPVGSKLLSLQENEQVEDLLGRRCVSLSTAIVQLFMCLPHSPGSWTLQQTGVICFVKDNPRRSYFIRLYDIKANKMIWEQELYNSLTYCRARPFFHTFPADDCQVGLNFADEQEAEAFFSVVDEKINQRNNRLEKRHGTGHAPVRDDNALPSVPPNGYGGPPQVPLGNININQAPLPKSKKEKKEKEKKSKKKGSKLSKTVIGAPSGFTHVSHVGMGGSSVDPDLMKLLSCAGIREADLNDTQTSQMIRDIIERSGGMEAVKKEVNQRERSLPPLPDARQGAAPPLPSPAPAQCRFGPLPPLPGGCQPTETIRSPPARGSLPLTPPVGRTGSLPPLPPAVTTPPSSTQGGRRGPLPQPPAATCPSHKTARSGSLPAVPAEHSMPLGPSVGQRGRTSLPETPSRRGSEAPPPPVGGRRESLQTVPRGRGGPPPPIKKNEFTMTPAIYEGGIQPPPPPPDSFLPPPPDDFLQPNEFEDLPPPPSFLPPSPNQQYASDTVLPPPPVSACLNVNKAGPPPPPPPPPAPPPQAAPPPCFGSAQPPPSRGPPPPPASSGGGGRGALLDQIRTGMKLKTVTASPEPPVSAAVDSGEGIVGALMMAMQKRSKVIQSSDEADEFDDEEDEDDEWD